MKKRVLWILAFFIFSWISLFFVSCGEDSGLGATIDTEWPKLSISYPPDAATIRGTFLFTGTCSDDKGISEVTVTVSNIEDSSVEPVNFQAEILNGLTWSVSLNEKSEAGYQFRDGKYKITAVAKDRSGHTTSDNRQFEIDNTAPVFIIKKPGVVRSSYIENKSLSKYGSLFTIEGTIADDHTISTMDVEIYDANGTLINSEPYSEEEISTSGGTSVTIARFVEGGTDTVNTRYNQIYAQGEADSDETKVYSCEVKLSDSAKVYMEPGDNGVAEGNATSVVYLYDELFDDYMSTKKGAGLTANDFLSVINGSATDDKLKNKGVKDVTVEQIKEVLPALAKDTCEIENNSLSFSLNPNSDPSYNISSFNLYYEENGETVSETTNKALGEQPLTIVVSSGLDQVNIVPSSLKVWIKEIGKKTGDSDDGVLSESVLSDDIDNLIEKVKRLENEEAASEKFAEVAGWKLVKDNSSDKSATDTTVTVSTLIPGGDYVQSYHYYSIVVTGCDKDDIPLSQSKLFGFVGTVSAVPPSVKIDEPTDGTYFKTSRYDSETETATDKLKFTGSAVENTLGLTLKKLTATLTVRDEITDTEIDSITISLDGDTNHEWASEKGFNCTYDPSTGKNNWEFIPSECAEYAKIAVESEGFMRLYTLKVTAVGTSGQSASDSLNVHIDTKNPVVEISSITPTVSGEEYFKDYPEFAALYDTYKNYTFINGELTVKGNIEEQNLNEVKYDIFASTNLTKTLTASDSILAKLGDYIAEKQLGVELDGSIGRKYQFSETFNTSLITAYFIEKEDGFTGDAPIQAEIRFTATDRVGNEKTYSSKDYNDGKSFYIYQETDRPKITFGNADKSVTDSALINEQTNLFGVTNNNALQISVSDDDGITDYRIYIWKQGEDEPAAPSEIQYPKKSTASINYLLPSDEGIYNVKVIARDDLNTDTYENPYGKCVAGPFKIAVDSGKATLIVSEPSKKGSWVSVNTNIPVSGTVSKYDGVTVSGYVYKAGVTPENIANLENISFPDAYEDKAYPFSATFKLPENAQGKYVLYVQAKDRYGRISSEEITVGVDSVAPQWKDDYGASPLRVNKKAYTYNSETGEHAWYNAEAMTFAGAILESNDGSGVESVYYKVIQAGDEDSAPSQISDFVTTETDYSFVTKRVDGTDYETFSTSIGDFIINNDESGNARPNIVYMMAADNAGNKSSVKKFYIYIDSESPNLDSDQRSTQYSNKTLPITVSGTASDDASGVESVIFTITENGKSQPLVIKDGSKEISATTSDNYANWSAVIPASFLNNLADMTYAVKAKITDKAGNNSSLTLFRIEVDGTNPEIKNLSLENDSTVYSVVKPDSSSETYFVHNKDGNKFTLSGAVSDDKSGVKEIVLSKETASGSVEISRGTGLPFDDIDLSGCDGDSVILTLSVKDNAGNEKTQNITVNFDNAAPKGLHALDEKSKDIFFRIGENDNDDIDKNTVDPNNSSKKLWSDSLDKDVGGKYSEGTYGNASTIRFRGAFTDGESGSGLSLIYYKVISEEKDNATLVSEGNSFYADFKNLADGYFAPLKASEEKRVFYTGSVKNAQDEASSLSETEGEYKGFVKDLGAVNDKNYATVISNFNNVISGFKSGKNYIFFVVVDKVGNSALDKVYVTDPDNTSSKIEHPDLSVNVDNTPPSAERTKAEGEADILYTNLTGTTVITGNASDSEAGLKSIVIKHGDKEIKVGDDINSASTNGTLEITSPSSPEVGDKNWSWKATIKNDKFFAGLTGSVSVQMIVTDNAGAGNPQTENLATVVVDTQEPTVSISAPSDADTDTPDVIDVNGEITLSGTSEDNNSVKEIVALYYKETLSAPTKPAKNTPEEKVIATSGEGALGWTKVTISDGKLSGTTNWKAEEIDTTAFTDATTTQANLYVVAAATDSAGNIGYSEPLPLRVDQDTDRPIVKFTNLSSSDGEYLLLRGTNAQITAQVSDDDGVDTVVISGSAYTGSETIIGTSEWSGTTLTAKFSPENTADGKKEVYIYVKDKTGKEFYTTHSTSDGNGGTTYLKIPKIKVGDEKLANTAAAQKFTYRSDSKGPSVTATEVFAYKSDGNSAGTSEQYETVKASYIVGGKERKYVKFKLVAKDESGIKGFMIELDYTDPSGTDRTKKYHSASDIGGTSGFEDGFGTLTADSDEISTWITPQIDVSGAKTGSMEIKVYPFDKSGLQGNGGGTFSVDNSGPEILVGSPVPSDEVTAKVTVSGTSIDNGSAGTSEIKWHIPTKEEVSNYNSASDKKAYLENRTWLGILANEKTASAWAFVFDGSGDGSENAAGNPLFDDYDNENYATPTADGIYYLPVWFRSTDKMGNTEFRTDFVIKHNPEADKPKLAFTYPTSASYDRNKNTGANLGYITLGGTIRATGSAEIPSGTTTVKGIYYQVDLEKNSDGSEKDADSFDKTFAESAATTGGYTIVNAYDVIKAVTGTEYNSASITDKLIKDFGFASKDVLENWWGIKASGGVSWSIVLNQNGEFNPAVTDNSTKDIKIRACGVNANGKFGAWTKTDSDGVIKVHVDKAVPTIEVSVNQYSEASPSVESSPSVTKVYDTDMFLRGQWYLLLTILDESGINEIKINGSAPASKTETTSADGKKSGYKVLVPIDTTSDTASYSVEAIDNDETGHTASGLYSFKIDNTAPSLENITGNDATLADGSVVENENYLYTVAGKSVDEGSGVERVVFYYMRKAGTTQTSISNEVLLDPLITVSGSNYEPTKIALSSSSLSPIELVQDSSHKYTLYAQSISGSVSANSENSVNTFSTTIALGTHIRTGGLVQIGGILRRIESVSSSDGTNSITFSPAATSTGDETALFPLAQVIDTTVKEELTSNAPNPFEFKTGKDDGDGMLESFTKGGSSWTWDASIHSDNLPDGPISLVILAFDKAGNVNGETYNLTVSNNAPRIAKLYFATDLDDNNEFADNEFESYSVIGATGKNQKNYTIDMTSADFAKGKFGAGVFTAKNKLAVVPEVVGGNKSIKLVTSKGATSETAVSGSGDSLLTSIANAKAADTNATALTKDNSVTTPYKITASNFKAAASGNSFHAFVLNNATLAGISAFDSNAAATGEGAAAKRAANEAADGSGKNFSFTFWDATEETVQGTSSQHAVILVKGFTLDLTDGTAPRVVVNPLYWQSLSSNSIYASSSAEKFSDLEGHIELENDLTETIKTSLGNDPKVSGKITFTGTAYDEHSLGKLTANFANIISDVDIATYNKTSSSWSVAAATMENDGYQVTIVSEGKDANGVYDDSTYYGQNGHKVYWTLSIDTEKLSTVVKKDVTLTVLATDLAGNVTPTTITAPTVTENYIPASETGTRTVSDGSTNVPSYQMDVVPYITGVETALSSLKKNNPSVYNRTAKGHYPVRTSETVTFSGFNLGATKTLDASTLTTSGKYDFAVTYTEGGSEVTVYSLNNTNGDNARGAYEKTVNLSEKVTGDKSIYANYYNRQPNGDNNNLLTDDVWFDVWQFKDAGISQSSGYITEPIMKVNPNNGMLNFGFNSGPANYCMANGQETSYTTWVGNYARFSTCGFTVDENGNTHGITVGLDTNPGNSHSAGRMQYFTSKWGTSTLSTTGNYEGKNSCRFETIGAPGGTYNGVTFDDYVFIEDRFASPSLTTVVHGNDTYVFLAYYDDLNAEIRFKWGNLSNAYYDTNTANTSVSGKQAITFDQFMDYRKATGWANNTHTAFDSNAKSENFSSIATPSTTAKAGNYVSIDVIKGDDATKDIIVATWYDASVGKWWYSYKTNPCNDNDLSTTTGDGHWNTPVELKANAGENCQIAVDAKGGIHIASYDTTNADLLYAYLSSYDDASPQIVTVDSYAFTGTNIRLDTAVSDDGNYVIPYIGYYMSSTQKPKMAYLPDIISASGTKATREAVVVPNGTDDSEAFTSKWETSIIPSESRFADNYAYSYVNIGLWKDSDGKAQNMTGTDVAYTKQSGLDKSNTSTVYGNGTKNPVLGYATRDGTRGHLETAQMK